MPGGSLPVRHNIWKAGANLGGCSRFLYARHFQGGPPFQGPHPERNLTAQHARIARNLGWKILLPSGDGQDHHLNSRAASNMVSTLSIGVSYMMTLAGARTKPPS